MNVDYYVINEDGFYKVIEDANSTQFEFKKFDDSKEALEYADKCTKELNELNSRLNNGWVVDRLIKRSAAKSIYKRFYLKEGVYKDVCIYIENVYENNDILDADIIKKEGRMYAHTTYVDGNKQIRREKDYPLWLSALNDWKTLIDYSKMKDEEVLETLRLQEMQYY